MSMRIIHYLPWWADGSRSRDGNKRTVSSSCFDEFTTRVSFLLVLSDSSLLSWQCVSNELLSRSRPSERRASRSGICGPKGQKHMHWFLPPPLTARFWKHCHVNAEICQINFFLLCSEKLYTWFALESFRGCECCLVVGVNGVLLSAVSGQPAQKSRI